MFNFADFDRVFGFLVEKVFANLIHPSIRDEALGDVWELYYSLISTKSSFPGYCQAFSVSIAHLLSLARYSVKLKWTDCIESTKRVSSVKHLRLPVHQVRKHFCFPRYTMKQHRNWKKPISVLVLYLCSVLPVTVISLTAVVISLSKCSAQLSISLSKNEFQPGFQVQGSRSYKMLSPVQDESNCIRLPTESSRLAISRNLISEVGFILCCGFIAFVARSVFIDFIDRNELD